MVACYGSWSACYLISFGQVKWQDSVSKSPRHTRTPSQVWVHIFLSFFCFFFFFFEIEDAHFDDAWKSDWTLSLILLYSKGFQCWYDYLNSELIWIICWFYHRLCQQIWLDLFYALKKPCEWWWTSRRGGTFSTWMVQVPGDLVPLSQLCKLSFLTEVVVSYLLIGRGQKFSLA
jgi:hypothetical protein